MTEQKSLSPKEVFERLERGDDFVLLDVREPFEVQIAPLQEALCIPMAEVPQQLEQLDRGKDIVVVCHHGIRSARVCQFLQSNGYDRVINLAGGIDAWAIEIDPLIPRY